MLQRLSPALNSIRVVSRSKPRGCSRKLSTVGTSATRNSYILPRCQRITQNRTFIGLTQANSPASRRYLSSPSAEPSSPADSTSFPDPSRPDLFYHLIYPPSPLSETAPVYALSFLSTAPPTADSAVIIGWLPAQTQGGDTEAGLNDFKENPKFREVLHEAIQAGLRENVDEIQRNAAIQLRDGWMHIHDDRNIPALGRIGDPDDILASVLVKDSKIDVDTYQPMPAYRLATADGITQLTPGLAQKLEQMLEQRVHQ